jgi:hypothetical protein
MHLYYQLHGEGKPLVVLHGGMLTIDLSFGDLIPKLAFLPNTTHMQLTHRIDLLVPLLAAFLSDHAG